MRRKKTVFFGVFKQVIENTTPKCFVTNWEQGNWSIVFN